ncbi:MAG: hypothetical protein ACT6S0_26815, partial [Roseateles sp.]|uniref:hypothetical protein n=1 Tax=Roseateles sp. TaxID=1971397 RepID=UPI0040365CEE
MTPFALVLQVVLHLQLPNDSRDVAPMGAAVGQHWHGPCRTTFAIAAGTDNAPTMHISELASKVGDCLNAVDHHLAQLGGSAR